MNSVIEIAACFVAVILILGSIVLIFIKLFGDH